MNRTNRTSVIRLSGVKAGVRALPDQTATYIRGGMGHKSAGGCSTAIFLTLLYHSRLPTATRPDRADTEEKGRTEATPPFLPLVRQTGRGFGAGGVTWFGAYPAPPYGGRFRPIYPCGKTVASRLAVSRDGRGRAATLGVGTARTKDGDTAVPGRLSRPPIMTAQTNKRTSIL